MMPSTFIRVALRVESTRDYGQSTHYEFANQESPNLWEIPCIHRSSNPEIKSLTESNPLESRLLLRGLTAQSRPHPLGTLLPSQFREDPDGSFLNGGLLSKKLEEEMLQCVCFSCDCNNCSLKFLKKCLIRRPPFRNHHQDPPERFHSSFPCSCFKNCLHFSICACHPCAGAMLIFSVSFQF